MYGVSHADFGVSEFLSLTPSVRAEQYGDVPRIRQLQPRQNYESVGTGELPLYNLSAMFVMESFDIRILRLSPNSRILPLQASVGSHASPSAIPDHYVSLYTSTGV